MCYDEVIPSKTHTVDADSFPPFLSLLWILTHIDRWTSHLSFSRLSFTNKISQQVVHWRQENRHAAKEIQPWMNRISAWNFTRTICSVIANSFKTNNHLLKDNVKECVKRVKNPSGLLSKQKMQLSWYLIYMHLSARNASAGLHITVAVFRVLWMH